MPRMVRTEVSFSYVWKFCRVEIYDNEYNQILLSLQNSYEKIWDQLFQGNSFGINFFAIKWTVIQTERSNEEWSCLHESE